MIPKGLFSQLTILVLSGLIIFTYIKPALLVTKATEDKISIYQDQQTKVTLVNDKLAKLTSFVDQVSKDDQQRLLTYMPNVVDVIAVPRDIKSITDNAGLILDDVRYDGPLAASIGESTDLSLPSEPQQHVFQVSFEGSYDQIKKVITSFEQNNYPLEVHDLQIQKQEGGFLKATAKLYAYNRQVLDKNKL